MKLIFDEESHTYTDADTGECLPSVTQLLERAGWRCSAFYTPEGAERGRLVHRLTARYDLKILSEEQVRAQTGYLRPWLLAHIAAMRQVMPEWQAVEVPTASARYRIAGTPDRVGLAWGAMAVWEVKTGAKDKKADDVQTALQALLEEERLCLKAEFMKRYVEYITPKGKFSIEESEPAAMSEARRIVRLYA